MTLLNVAVAGKMDNVEGCIKHPEKGEGELRGPYAIHSLWENVGV